MSLQFHATIEGLEKLQKLQNWQPVLEEWLTIAERLSLRDLKEEAKSETLFMHPTGKLESRFLEPLYSTSLPTISGAVTNDSPYAFRREYGFSGQSDAIGRFYKSDPGTFFMARSLIHEYDDVRARFNWAVKKALKELTSQGE